MNELNLNEGERILYECYGKLKHVILKMKPSGRFKIPIWRNPTQILMSSGKIFITNYRIIAHGEIKVKGGRAGGGSDIITGLIVPLLSGHSKRNKTREELSEHGHEIPIKKIGKLRKTRNGIAFEVKVGNLPGNIRIKPSETSQVKLEETMYYIFELLSEFNEIDYSLFNDRLRPLIYCAIFIIIGVIGTYISNIT